LPSPVDRQHLQLVCLRMWGRGQHARNAEARQRSRIFDAFDLKPDAVEGIGNLFDGRIGFEIIFEPGEREFHAPTPPLSVGTSSALNP
jgi:hypothetical protein